MTIDYIRRFTNDRTPVKESWPWIKSKGKKGQVKALRVLRGERKGHLSEQVFMSEMPRKPPVWPGAPKHDICQLVIGDDKPTELADFWTILTKLQNLETAIQACLSKLSWHLVIGQ